MATEYRNSRIDWNYWLNMPYVKLWQACALSLQIDPDSMSPMHDRYSSGPGGRWVPGEGLNSKQREVIHEFKKRVSLLHANRLNREFFTYSGGLMNFETDVRLPEFARWIVAVGRDPVSPELLGLVDGDGDANKVNHGLSETTASWQNELPKEARERRLDKYKYQWPLWKEGLKLLENAPSTKVATLADDLRPIATRLGFLNRSGAPLDSETIRRHVLPGIKKAYQAKNAQGQ